MIGKYAIAYAGGLVVLLALDALWLGLIMRDFYKNELGALMRERPQMAAAGLFYVVYVVGVAIFAISPALDHGEWVRALILGGLFGFFAYFTYDMVNFATLNGYSLRLTMVDIAWGIFVSASSAVGGYFAVQWFAR